MRKSLKTIGCLIAVFATSVVAQLSFASDVVIASKKFTESVILGDIASTLLQANGIPTEHKRELGLSQVMWKALLRGDLGVYPEYTGTLTRELLAKYQIKDLGELKRTLKDNFKIGMTAPLGFTNTFALGVPQALAEKLKLDQISDLLKHPELRFGFSHEFIHRPEAWPTLKTHYGFHNATVLGIEHEISYRALKENMIDVTDLYATDADIPYYNIRVLKDDLHHFPDYQAIYLYRLDLAEAHPNLVATLKSLEGQISQDQMIALNKHAKLDRMEEKEVANQFLTKLFPAKFNSNDKSDENGMLFELWLRTQEHLFLVGVSLVLSILIAIPLGILSSKSPKWGSVILWSAGIIQTIPSVALLVLMIPFFGIGKIPSIAALLFYGLLPIIRNTYSGITDIPETIRCSAIGLGLTSWQILRLVELPMAAKSIFAGIKTSAVISVGTATLGSIIGAGGLGQQILTGVRRDDLQVILSGAIPAALLAIGVQFIFDLTEKKLFPSFK